MPPPARVRLRHELEADAPPPYSSAAERVSGCPAARSATTVAVEEPLEIRIGGEPVAVTMRTPGHDEELALGFCSREGSTASAASPDDLAANTVDVDAPGLRPRPARAVLLHLVVVRGLRQGRARGGRGRARRRVESRLADPRGSSRAPDRLREAQAAFAATGGLHATGLFTPAGESLCTREDVGRHNAMDKVVGWAFLDGLLPLREQVLCVSGRLSFELVQKAAVAGCPSSSPSALRRRSRSSSPSDRGVTLCGFVRDGPANVYSRPERIAG